MFLKQTICELYIFFFFYLKKRLHYVAATEGYSTDDSDYGACAH